jgi:ribosomal protein S1
MHTESATQSGRYAGSEGTTPATTVSQRDISEAEDVDEEYRLDVEEARIERRFDRTVIASRRRLLERTRSKNARV